MSCILVCVAMLSLAFEKNAIVARSIAFSFQFWFAPLFYLTYMAIAERISAVLIVAVGLELLFLTVYQVMFRGLFAAVTAKSPQYLSRMLNYLEVGMWLIAILSIPIFIQSGVGIFASGSRNEFLEGSRLNIYLVYASTLVQYAMVPIVAAVINTERRWRVSVILYLVMISVLSVLSASKGGVVLSICAIASLLKFERIRDTLRLLFVPVCGAAALIASTIYAVGRFLSLGAGDMISLMFARLFLANDARALALDWSGYMGHNTASLFRESFRLFSTSIGNAPQFPPLGELLYTLQFGTTGFVGANTSSSALLIAYGSDIEKGLFALLLAGIAVGTGLLSGIPGRGNVPRLAIGIGLLSLLSQDFLAFQILINILLLLLVAVICAATLTRVLRLASAPARLADEQSAILPRP
jgi:hypothetical protein